MHRDLSRGRGREPRPAPLKARRSRVAYGRTTPDFSGPRCLRVVAWVGTAQKRRLFRPLWDHTATTSRRSPYASAYSVVKGLSVHRR